MQNIITNLFEIFLFALLVPVFLHAKIRHGTGNALRTLVPFFVYGWLLEVATILSFDAYAYNVKGFAVVVFGAPLCIAAGWCSITYCCIRLSEQFTVTRFRFLVAGLLALLIDLSMDGIAVYFSFWTWAPEVPGVPHSYFNVPVGNYVAWFTIVSSCCWFHTRLKDTALWRRTAGSITVFGSFMVLFIVLTIIDASKFERLFVGLPWHVLFFGLAFPVSLITMVLVLRRFNTGSDNDRALMVYELLHLFFLALAISLIPEDARYLLAGVVAALPGAVLSLKTRVLPVFGKRRMVERTA